MCNVVYKYVTLLGQRIHNRVSHLSPKDNREAPPSGSIKKQEC